MVTTENYVLGLKSGSVGLADNENYRALVPSEIRSQLDDIAVLVGDGEVEVRQAVGMPTEEVAEIRDSMKP